MELETLKSRFDESEANNNKNQNELQNRIDVLESIISMICYRDLIKEITEFNPYINPKKNQYILYKI